MSKAQEATKEPCIEIPPPRRRRVAVCGTSATTVGLAPHQLREPDGSWAWEIWTLGIAQKLFPRQDRHFQLHNLEEGAQRWSEDYKSWLHQTRVPVFLQELNPAWVPAGLEFPLDRILAEFPLSGQYQTCMISMMVALAIMENVDELGIYGCELAHDSEYAYQRPCVEHWLGIAIGRGIQVHVPRESDLLKTSSIYGYETHGGRFQSGFSRCVEQRQKEVEARLAGYQRQHEEIKKAMHILQGAHESNRYWRHWAGFDRTYNGVDHVLEETKPERVLSVIGSDNASRRT